MALFAVHLLDGSLPPLWCVAGYAGAIALALVGCWRLHERDIPRIALATAAFFVASSIHVPVPGGSVHLVLNGLVGVMLGLRAGLALMVGLLLQALLIGHGGTTTLGVNVVLQTLPALAVGGAFWFIAALPKVSIRALAVSGGLLSTAGVLATVLLQSGLLWLSGDEGRMPAFLWFALHVPVALVEGVIVGFMVHYLARVKPELLGIRSNAAEFGEFASCGEEKAIK